MFTCIYYILQSIAIRMEQYLNKHDRADPTVRHQGMVITQTKTRKNPAEPFCKMYNQLFPNKCAVYVHKTSKVILEQFVRGEIRVLVIIGRLLEGFDHDRISVLGIVRNIAPTSRVLFAQFVGRAVRKTSPVDPVIAWIVSHECFNQRQNYNTFDKLAEEDPIDNDDDDDGDDDDDDQMMMNTD